MTEATTQHRPTWVDLGTSDLEGAKRFYGELFGWEAETVAPPEYGNYANMNLNGKPVAGAGDAQPGQPTVWTVYISTPDVDSTLAMVKDAGGEVVMPAMDIMDAGRLGIFQDPTGAFVGLWQGAQHTGAQIMNETGSFAWAELHTPDMEAAKTFYTSVFGWTEKTSPLGPMEYTEWKLGDESIGGGMTLSDEMQGVPPHWMVYFAVDDVDVAAAKVQELGGTVMVQPDDFPGGRFAIVTDPQGATFGLLRMAAQQ